MVEELQQPYFIENVGNVGEDATSTTLNQIKFSSLLYVENVHLESGNVALLNVANILRLIAIKTQALIWKPHSHMSICWGFFVMNDGLHVDLVNPQM
jgi:hypothetical protein